MSNMSSILLMEFGGRNVSPLFQVVGHLVWVLNVFNIVWLWTEEDKQQ